MRSFTRNELISVLLIFLVVFIITSFNLNIAIRRARDAQRRSDLGLISDTLDKFFVEYGYFPPSEGGKIKMCKSQNFEEIIAQVKSKSVFDRQLFFQSVRPCEWGKDGLYDVLDATREPYLKTFPSDPKLKEGLTYLYLSNTNRYQLFTSLEGGDSEVGYDKNIIKRNLMCGDAICSYGKSYATPLEKSIEEYEAELLQKSTGK